MKRFVLAVLITLGSTGFAAAQSSSDLTPPRPQNVYRFNAVSSSPQLFPVTNADSPITSLAPFANPAPAADPAPKFYYGNSEDYRFQLSLGYEYVHFRSTPFNSNLNGVHTSL